MSDSSRLTCPLLRPRYSSSIFSSADVVCAWPIAASAWLVSADGSLTPASSA